MSLSSNKRILSNENLSEISLSSSGYKQRYANLGWAVFMIRLIFQNNGNNSLGDKESTSMFLASSNFVDTASINVWHSLASKGLLLMMRKISSGCVDASNAV